MFKDIRYHDFHTIEGDFKRWSTDWQRFPGLPYIPLITELEEWLLPIGDSLHTFMQQKWHFSLYISLVYIAVILVLKECMSKRQTPFNLRLPMAYWSSFLAIFSIIGVMRCLPEFVHILAHKGFDASFRDSSYYKDWRLNLWYLFFVWSKAFELVDTLFIVLRKQKLLTLHWVHHCLTLTYSWFVFSDVPATARWMVNMNFLIHSLMYSYYACKAFQIKIPRAVNISITSLQILQMLYGLWINIRVVQLKITEQPCDSHISVGLTGLFLYGLFFVLFVNFFVRSYLLKPTAKTIVFSTPSVADKQDSSQSKKVDDSPAIDSTEQAKAEVRQRKNGFVERNNNMNYIENNNKKSL